MINNIDKKEYKKYFNLKATSNLTSATQRISHGFNIIKTNKNVNKQPWHTYDLVSDKLYLGQIPNVCMTKDFDTIIFPNQEGLVIACNSLYELADIGSAVSVISPITFQNKGIDHHHLPFTDFSTDANDGLVANALVRMLQAKAENKPIYVHCKAGRSRSGMIVSLYQALTQEKYIKQLNNIFNGYQLDRLDKAQMDTILDELETLIKVIETDLQQDRPQVDLGEKARLAAGLLLTYKQNGQLQIENNQVQFDTNEATLRFDSKEEYLKSACFLKDISQTSAFKALAMAALKSNTATKTSKRFEAIQSLYANLYENPVASCEALNAVIYKRPIKSGNTNQANLAKSIRSYINASPASEMLWGSQKDQRKQLLDDLDNAITKSIQKRLSKNSLQKNKRVALKNSNNNML